MRKIKFIKDDKAYSCDVRSYQIGVDLKPGREIIYVDKEKFFFVDIEIHDDDGAPIDDVLEFVKKLDAEGKKYLLRGSITISGRDNNKIQTFDLRESMFLVKSLSVMAPDDENADYLIFNEEFSIPLACIYNFISFDGKVILREACSFGTQINPDDADKDMRKKNPYENE